MPRPRRNYAAECGGILKPSDPLARFASKCAFDPVTGCVMWVGTTTHGHGRTQPYGYFWFEGRMVLAHRWSAEHIHGLDIRGLEVDHCCPAGPSTLCVQHVKPEPGTFNRSVRFERDSRPVQSLRTKRYWLFVGLGIEPPPVPPERDLAGVPFYDPPSWLLPFLPPVEVSNDCPF